MIKISGVTSCYLKHEAFVVHSSQMEIHRKFIISSMVKGWKDQVK